MSSVKVLKSRMLPYYLMWLYLATGEWPGKFKNNPVFSFMW